MAEQSPNRALVLAAVTFVIIAAIGAAFVRLVENRRLDAGRRTAVEIGTSQSFAISRQIDAAVAVAQQLAAVLEHSQAAAFTAAAPAALKQTSIVFGLAFAPGLRIGAIHPPSLPDAVGTDLAVDPLQSADVGRLRETAQPLVGAPVAGTAEGTLVHVYAPVLDENRVVGAVISYVRVADLLRAGDVARAVRTGYEYRIGRTDPASGRLLVFARSTELDLIEPIRVPVSVPGTSWTLELSPRDGWMSRAFLAREAGVALLVAILIALFVYDILRRPEVLEREVEARARKLVEANRRIVTEVEQRERAEEQAVHEATHDRLTELPNRRYLLDRLGRALDRGRYMPFVFGVLLVDLDRFTTINDTLGHSIGDQLLMSVRNRLQSCLRFGDILARTGGDEFAIVAFEVAEITDLIRVARRCHEALEVPFDIDDRKVFTSASIGIAVSSSGYNEAGELLRDANIAMSRARNEGGGRHLVFDPDMHARAVAMLQIENDLRRGMEQGELRSFFQPIISLTEGNITGFEALIRWQHDGKMISPGAFLPVAVASGLIVPLDRWILRDAARQLNEWHTQFAFDRPLTCSVNISGKRLSDPLLVDEVAGLLRDTGLDPRTLRIEITEGEMMDNPDSVIKVLRQLKEMQITLLVDDFGTGYSSLSYLQRFPIDIVKIDQSFVKGMIENPKDEEIVRAIINLAQILGLGVVAEGIETATHLARLRELGCGHGQGYFFSKPGDPETIGALVGRNPRW